MCQEHQDAAEKARENVRKLLNREQTPDGFLDDLKHLSFTTPRR